MEQPRRDPNEPTNDELEGNRRAEPAPTGSEPVNRSPMSPVTSEGDRPMTERDRQMRDREMADRNRAMAPHDGGREDLWPEMSDFRRRFDQIQVEFVEEPREAVRKAENLLKEAVDRMTSSLHGHLKTIHGDVGDGNSDTERLRLAMQRLRRMIDSFGERRAA